jgi:hypothetical protein
MSHTNSTTSAFYTIKLNRRLQCRELIRVEDESVIEFADLDDNHANVELTARCNKLNSQAAAMAAQLEAERDEMLDPDTTPAAARAAGARYEALIEEVEVAAYPPVAEPRTVLFVCPVCKHHMIETSTAAIFQAECQNPHCEFISCAFDNLDVLPSSEAAPLARLASLEASYAFAPELLLFY